MLFPNVKNSHFSLVHPIIKPNISLSRRGMFATFPNRISKLLEDFDGRLPVDTSISNADTLLESGRSLCGYFLVAFVDVGLDHDTDDGFFTRTELITNDLGYLGLVSMVFV